MGTNNAKLYDIQTLLSMGFDPRTGLPTRAESKCTYKADIKKQLRILDEQNAVNRFTWHNLPDGLNGRLIERILYYKGQGMFFFLKDKFFFLPYALAGTIDVYGRFVKVTPLPFNGTSNDGKNEGPWIQGLAYEPVYDVQFYEDYEALNVDEIVNSLETKCVLLKDYTEQISQTNISRQIINDPILDIMAECFPYMRTALKNSTGIQGMRVSNENESSNVYAANNAINRAALNGDSKVPIIGSIDFQDLANGATLKSEEFLLAMQALDNYRLSLYGLDNGGLFQKKSHMLEAEQQMNTGNVGLVMRDSLQNRQEFCTIVNSIFGLDIWCEPSEVILNMDINGDGYASDDVMANEKTNEEENEI